MMLDAWPMYVGVDGAERAGRGRADLSRTGSVRKQLEASSTCGLPLRLNHFFEFPVSGPSSSFFCASSRASSSVLVILPRKICGPRVQ